MTRRYAPGPTAASRAGRRRGDVSRFLAALALAAVAGASMTGTSHADTLAEAKDAFDGGRVERAVEIWRELARTGEAEAAFRLGLVDDLGLGRAPDPAAAFRWYLEAARRGHATAQFNVGVMFDAGTGTLASPSAAARWYARAAARGFARAEYNLALLYADGEGLPRNVALARAWMSRAATTLPSARERLGELRALDPTVSSLPVEPVPLAASMVSEPGGDTTLELVWTTEEQPPGTRYRVELGGAEGGDGAGDEASEIDPVEVSAVVIPHPSNEPRRWRVLATNGERSVASTWQALPVGGEGDLVTTTAR